MDEYGLDDRTAIMTALKDCKLVSVEQVRHCASGRLIRLQRWSIARRGFAGSNPLSTTSPSP